MLVLESNLFKRRRFLDADDCHNEGDKLVNNNIDRSEP